MLDSRRSQEEFASDIEKIARSGNLGYNTHNRVRTTTLPNGDIVITAESTSGIRGDTGVEIQVSQNPNRLGSRAIFNASRNNTAAISKINDIEKAVRNKLFR